MADMILTEFNHLYSDAANILESDLKRKMLNFQHQYLIKACILKKENQLLTDLQTAHLMWVEQNNQGRWYVQTAFSKELFAFIVQTPSQKRSLICM